MSPARSRHDNPSRELVERVEVATRAYAGGQASEAVAVAVPRTSLEVRGREQPHPRASLRTLADAARRTAATCEDALIARRQPARAAPRAPSGSTKGVASRHRAGDPRPSPQVPDHERDQQRPRPKSTNAGATGSAKCGSANRPSALKTITRSAASDERDQRARSARPAPDERDQAEQRSRGSGAGTSARAG